jgi:hypothetical protein
MLLKMSLPSNKAAIGDKTEVDHEVAEALLALTSGEKKKEQKHERQKMFRERQRLLKVKSKSRTTTYRGSSKQLKTQAGASTPIPSFL